MGCIDADAVRYIATACTIVGVALAIAWALRGAVGK